MVVVDKPAGWTSHQVVARMRRLLGTRKVGHAGTLDPMATGVLLVGANRATRLLGYLARTDKTYTATIRLGISTVTDDADGDPTTQPGAAGIDDRRIESVLTSLRGGIEQVPSSVSAIKVGGVRSYARVRAGDDVALAARPVTVSRFDVLGRRDLDVAGTAVTDLDVVVDCSTGTYIRALARDLGVQLGTGGHLTALRRTRVGAYAITAAQSLEPAPERVALVPLAEVARRTFLAYDLDADQAAAVRYGRRLPGLALGDAQSGCWLPGAPVALFDPDGEFLALYRGDGSDAVPEAVFVG